MNKKIEAMKTNVFSLRVSYVLILVILFGCSKGETVPNETANLQISDFKPVAEMYNSFLSNSKENFKIPENVIEQEEKIEVIFKFNNSFANSLNMSDLNKDVLVSELNRTKGLVIENTLISKSFGSELSDRTDVDNESSLFEVINSLKDEKIITAKSYEILTSLSNYLKANYEGSLSDENLKSRIYDLAEEFNNSSYQKNTDGELIGSILAISISSIQWWEENPDALEGLSSKNSILQKSQIAPWLAADLVGAAWGGTTGAIASYAGTGEVNWTAVGIGAVSGAISGSTGAIGKIAKWLVK